jgi:hypothetical protein
MSEVHPTVWPSGSGGDHADGDKGGGARGGRLADTPTPGCAGWDGTFIAGPDANPSGRRGCTLRQPRPWAENVN